MKGRERSAAADACLSNSCSLSAGMVAEAGCCFCSTVGVVPDGRRRKREAFCRSMRCGEGKVLVIAEINIVTAVSQWGPSLKHGRVCFKYWSGDGVGDRNGLEKYTNAHSMTAKLK